MDVATTILGLLGIAVGIGVFVVAYIGPVAWAIGDAQRRGKSTALIVLLFCLSGPLSALVWLVIRPSETLAEQSPREYANAEDALAAASCLDQIGEWDAAIALYRNADKRWPEQHDYIAACIKAIQEKQALAE